MHKIATLNPNGALNKNRREYFSIYLLFSIFYKKDSLEELNMQLKKMSQNLEGKAAFMEFWLITISECLNN